MVPTYVITETGFSRALNSDMPTKYCISTDQQIKDEELVPTAYRIERRSK
jgi:hypothetical protein